MAAIGLKFFRRENRLAYLVFDPASREGLAIDAHPEQTDDFREYLADHGLKLKHVYDTEAWERSGSSMLAGQYGATSVDAPVLGGLRFDSRPAAGLAPGARALVGAGVAFSGQAILLGDQEPLLVTDPAAARAFREQLLASLPPETLVFPAVDQREILCSTAGVELGARGRADTGVSGIGVEKYAAKLADRVDGSAYIDVREPAEFEAGHPAGARNIPLSELGFHREELLGFRRVYVSCLSGRRSAVAAKTLAYWGAPEVINVSGGYQAWCQAGLKIEKGGAPA